MTEIPIPTSPLDPTIATAESAAPEVATTDEVFASAPGAVAESIVPQAVVAAPETDAPIPDPQPPILDLREPPRPLVPGAFLHGEYEIKTVLVRGFTNLYLAQAGDYGEAVPFLIAEREADTALAPSTLPLPQPISAAPDEESISGVLLTDQAEWVESGESGAMPDEANIFDAPEIQGSTEAPDEIPAPQSTLAADAADADKEPEVVFMPVELFPMLAGGESWEQDGRLYRAYEWQETVALQDYREPTNDLRYGQMLSKIAQALAWAEENELALDLSHELLRVDEAGGLKYFGFAQPRAGSRLAQPIEQLRDLNEFLLKHVFANSRTMRLDDQFAGLALTEEVKELARAVDSGEFSSTAAVAQAGDALFAPLPEPKMFLLSDVGRERELNEDSGAIMRYTRSGHLHQCNWECYVVADGMGGHEGGEVASDITVRALQSTLNAEIEIDWNDNSAVQSFLLRAIEHVNAQVVALIENPKYRATRARPGSTLTFIFRLGARLFIGNVGDSRAYRWSAAHGLERLSKDHSYVQTLIDAGQLTEEEAWDHPEGSVITAHIGDPKGRTRDLFLRLARPGDKLLLVSDGVVDMLRDREIEPFLHESDAATICRKLVDASNARGGLDNITALCVIFE